MSVWDDLLSDRDRRVIEASGHGARRGLGARPVVLVVDAQAHFVGVRGDVFASTAVYPTSVGEEAWAAVARIQTLVASARARGIPVMYSKSGIKAGEEAYDSFARKRRSADVTGGVPSLEMPIVAEIAPRPREVVIEKRFPSAFFGSPLASFLHADATDTILLAGFTTSGCVRATCVDAMSYNFRVGVVADGCADRLHVAHKASLLDMHLKYGDVIDTAQALEYLARFGRTPAVAT
jgi:nicotinamidase-related amidase